MSRSFEVPYSPDQSEFWVYPCPRKSRINIINELQGITERSQLSNSITKRKLESLQNQIVDLQASVQGNIYDLNTLQLEYIRAIDDELKKNQPFQYHGMASANERTDRELSFYWSIISHSMIGNNFYLLRKWGIDYPFNQDSIKVYPVYTPGNYIDFFEKRLTSRPQDEIFHRLSAPYLEYLVEKLSDLTERMRVA